MTRKTRIKQNKEIANVIFTNWLNNIITIASPKNLFIISGRATSKTSEIHASRSQEIIYDMPGAYFAWIADTYVNAHKNILPVLIEGWNRKGWIEGKHYVVDKRPPDSWKKPYKNPLSYKHTVSLSNGCFFNIVSADQPSSSADNSYQHLFGDEVKYIDPEKLKKLTPAIRGGKEIYSYSPFFQGRSFTTDMPIIGDKEYDWILDYENLMNEEQIIKIIQIGFVLNEIKIEIYKAVEANATEKELNLLQKKYNRWLLRWTKSRYGSTLFFIATSFINVDYLGLEWFQNTLSEGLEDFKTSVISLKSSAKSGEKFYPNLGEHHFYEDGNLESYNNRFGIKDTIHVSSEMLKYCKTNLPLELGIDFGNMLSLVSAQTQGNYIYILKNFYTLPKASTKELVDDFTDFYRTHKNKRLEIYYDRSGNQYEQIGRDWISEFEYYLKLNNWSVELMSRNQATIYQAEEYKFMLGFLGEYDPDLPKVRIDKFNCRELRSSLGLAKTIISTNSKGQRVIKKNKNSERLHISKLPMQSTNFSDAFKYLFCRNDWKEVINRSKKIKFSTPQIY